MLKQELRKRIREIKRQFTPQQLVQLSFPVLERLKPLLRDANVVMAYYSLPDEVYTHDLLDELVEAGKTVLLPQVVDNETMVLRGHIYLENFDLTSAHDCFRQAIEGSGYAPQIMMRVAVSLYDNN